MRSIFSILFFLLIAFQAVHLPVLSLWLNIQQDYIATNLCENRFEPELMCSGRCYISTQTAEAIGQQEQSDDAPVAALNWSRLLSPFVLSSFLLPEFPVNLSPPSAHYQAPIYAFLYVEAVFHPPC